MALTDKDSDAIRTIVAETISQTLPSVITEALSKSPKGLTEEDARRIEGLVDAKVESIRDSLSQQVQIDLLTKGIGVRTQDDEPGYKPKKRTNLLGENETPPTRAQIEKALAAAPRLYLEPITKKAKGEFGRDTVEHVPYTNFRVVGDEIHADSSKEHQPGKWLIRRILDDLANQA